MIVQKGDYIVVKPETKAVLCKAIKVKDSYIRAIIEDKFSLSKDAFTSLKITNDEVLANVGNNPEFGDTVFGVKIEPLVSESIIKPFGRIYYYRKLEEIDKSRIVKALDNTAIKLKKYNLTGKLPIEIQVRPKKGKYEGMYHHYGSEEQLDILTIKPQVFNDLNYLVYHEIAHYIWFNYCTDKTKSLWVNLYHSSVELSAFKTQEIKDIYRKFIDSGEEIKEFRGNLDEKEQDLFDLIISHVNDTHKLTNDDIMILIKSGKIETLNKLSPIYELEDSEIKEIVSSYATKSVSEFFAESLSYFWSNKKISKKVSKLVLKTLKILKGQN